MDKFTEVFDILAGFLKDIIEFCSQVYDYLKDTLGILVDE